MSAAVAGNRNRRRPWRFKGINELLLRDRSDTASRSTTVMKIAQFLLLWALLLLEPALVHARSTSKDLADLALDPHPGARLPLALELVDEAGRSSSLGSYFGGKPVVLILEYLRCKWVCGLALGNLAEAGSRLLLRAGRDYTVLAISIDPRDTPQEAAAA